METTADKLCIEYTSKKVKKKLTVKTLADNEVGNEFVLIEGEAEALEFLGKLILSQAKYQKDCSFSIGPKTAGSTLFSKKSLHGIYIHRLPCPVKHS